MSRLLRICVAAIVGLVVSSWATHSFGGEVRRLSFDDPGDGLTITDSVSGNDVGAFEGGALFGTANPPCLDSGAANTSYGDFSGDGFATITGAGYIFHDVTAGGVAGDATLEFLFNSPSQSHASIFWTNADNGDDDERFNFFYNAGPHGAPADTIGSDVAGRGGKNPLLDFATGVDVSVTDVWHHLALVREDLGGETFAWSWYLNGALAAEGTSNTSMPLSSSWLIAGRTNAPSWRGLIDELSMHDNAVDPGDFNLVCPPDCPTGGANFQDTTCLEVLIDPEPADPLPPAGTFAITADGLDETGDPLIYIFTIEDSFGETRQIVSAQSFLNTILTEGAWTITVRVDDDRQCNDDAPTATCNVIDIDVGPAPPFQGELLVRFEEGSGTDLGEAIGGGVAGELLRGAGFSDDAPELSSAVPNNFSMDVLGGGALMSSAFIFHDRSAGGAEGDATLEWFQKIPAEGQTHTSIFWTRENTLPDANRFNIYYNASFTNLPGSEDFINGDQRDPDGLIGDIGGAPNAFELPRNVWYSVHITRALVDPGDNGTNPSYEWNWYYNGIHHPAQTATTNLIQPTSVFWQISGREGFPFNGKIDEIHGIDRVLLPEEMTTIVLDCPDDGDTTCISVDISPAPDEPPPGAGVFTITADGADEDGDTVLYTYVANNFFDPLQKIGPTDRSQVNMFLTEGAWTISVTTDDNVFCPDTAPGNSCEIDIDIGPAAPFTDSTYRFEEGAGTDVIDSEGGTVHGQLVDGATFNPDAPSLASGAPNNFSADFNVGGALMTTPFAFQSPASGGATGDASVEWLMKVPDQGHATIFWTNADDDNDSNRYNIFWNSGQGVNGTRTVAGDANPGGVIGNFGFGVEVPVDQWSQVAIVRTDDGGGGYLHQWFFNGVHNPDQDSTISQVSLPSALTWRLAGRQGGAGVRGLIDEIRMVGFALQDVDMNVVSRDCPPDGDTTCDSFQVAGPVGNVAGSWTGFGQGTDENGEDFFLDIFGSRDGGDPVLLATGSPGVPVNFNLQAGEWVLTAVADDDRFCPDKDPDNSCSTNITVNPRPPFEELYFRFEEEGGDPRVTLEQGAVIGTDVPNATVPGTRVANNGSLDTTAGGFARINSAFVFHDPNVGGAEGDATLEWFFKVPPEGGTHSSMFWTNGDTPGDEQRFNIFWNAQFTGAPDSDRFISGDFRQIDPSPLIVLDHDTGNALDLDTWHHVAIVRTVSDGDGVDTTFDWVWHINGVESLGHTATTSDAMPTASSWLIAGRSGASSFAGKIDEVRLSGCALSPGKFLTSNDGSGCGDGESPGKIFRRGDCDQSGKVDFNDAIFHLRFLFLGENEDTVNRCKDACDSDDSGTDDFTDDINTLKVLFLGQGEIVNPGPLADETHPCGVDPTLEEPEELTCDTYDPTIACP